jgi:hypothetical protein
MRSFSCSCGNQLFFDNSICMCCKREVGWCPQCQLITDVVTGNDGAFTCPQCDTTLVKCVNYASSNVCNRFVIRRAGEGNQAKTSAGIFCDCCRYNRIIPDLKIAGNHEKWYRIEAAKRRTLYDLNLLGLPYGDARDNVAPALVFEFKGDPIADKRYRDLGGGQKVFTGHDNGVITINIQEADDVEREKLRVNMHEAHRSLLGHFRHEFGHYIWDVMIKGKPEAESAFAAMFGDHNNPPYDQALQAYYKDGPKPDWLLNYVSAYATMHPWEDFAETFAVYLDMTSALDSAFFQQLIPLVDPTDLDALVDAYRKLGIALNEMNRTIGLLDFLPELFAKPIREKLRFIHGLTRNGRREPALPPPSPSPPPAPGVAGAPATAAVA